ncbi:3-hydroxyacyl-CoA dehydrogenase NAD-binding domain-containing protein [Sphingobacterium sp. UT-1RO-CII-1]|uniref:3-hydroxyacyl-CoA dehydrogenase/enoyl-CoA hydratase family protein n=1 Tax=Sphingobacterium sp. UT-1RO-CII-1 TaxID=2995225 RepID=UPI00227A40D5|nr:3-hydroxyacyl-CoA dehydrogenase/enoyl-CoA hydratase family protein [Sphingobacterium sp. UT-1RO-CII-1]MCY4778466.1 3-hydroxyacyl-CoA dehydrogenase NAD-binding domain-containing protein [Sphingobacterium sp. UT-1RO-CII-1]
MNRSIKRVAVLGSGVMGSRIACHFANIGVEVLLLDIVPKELLPVEKAKGLTLESTVVRNRIVNGSLETALKTNPSPIFSKSYVSRIKTGNFDDNLKDIGGCDWVIEVVVERLDIKKDVFSQVEKYRKPGTLITSNTSGIPIHLMTEGRSEDFKAHFCGTHFFNPPRYLELLEIIPTTDTKPEVIDFITGFGDKMLGKSVVLCKDTPAFIGNRIGVYSMLSITHLVEQMGMSVEEVDKYTGPAMGHPKSATFRTADVVGLDTLVNVANGLLQNAPKDEAREVFKLPAYLMAMVNNKWLGEKSKQGFYKKTKDDQGKTAILSLDLKTLEYKEQSRVKSATLEATKLVEDIHKRMKVYEEGKDMAGQFFRAMHYPLFEYVSRRVPEITDDFYRIDDAMRAGFGWELGPFEVWDALNVRETLAKIKKEEKRLPGQTGEVAQWVLDMLDAGCESFYKIENGIKHFYDIKTKTYIPIPGAEDLIVLDNIRNTKTIWKNSGVTILDLGDGIINCEFHTKMNTIGGDVIQGINKAIDLAEKEYRGLVITNDGKNFSAGANIGMIFMMAVEQDYDELNMAVRMFQNTSMRIRYSSIPVVVAPFQLTLGGGCEFSMHADFVQLHAETYMGLVEFGVGVIPGGGGSKEFALRASDEYKDGQITQNILRDKFLTIGQAKVSTSAVEAAELGYLKEGKYEITMNRKRLLMDAKAKALELANAGYVQPVPRNDIQVLGNDGLGIVYVGASSMHAGNYISAHDRKISEKLGWVMCGGDLSAPTLVSEQYLLDMERKAFLELCAERKTLERIQHMLTKGKPLRN